MQPDKARSAFATPQQCCSLPSHTCMQACQPNTNTTGYESCHCAQGPMSWSLWVSPSPFAGNSQKPWTGTRPGCGRAPKNGGVALNPPATLTRACPGNHVQSTEICYHTLNKTHLSWSMACWSSERSINPLDVVSAPEFLLLEPAP